MKINKKVKKKRSLLDKMFDNEFWVFADIEDAKKTIKLFILELLFLVFIYLMLNL